MQLSLRSLRPTVILLCACVGRTTGGSASGDQGTGDPAGSTAGSDPATSIPTTTGPATGDPSSTAATDISTTSDPPGTTAGVELDMSMFFDPPPGLAGCTLASPPGTSITGQTRLGAFAGERAYFGAVTYGGLLEAPELMVLTAEADATAEFKNQDGLTGAITFGKGYTHFYDDWLGTWEFSPYLYDKGWSAYPFVTLTITELAGTWDAPDPDDPPRLIGTLAGDLSGPFDAVYCDQLDVDIIPD